MRSRGSLQLLVSNDPKLIAPCGDGLTDLTVPAAALDGLKAYASQLPSIQISPRSVCDLELLATGALSPLDRFMGHEDYQHVLEEKRLAHGQIFPIPITLPVEASPDLHLDRDIALRSSEYELLGVLTVDEIYQWDRNEFADRVFGTQDIRHPLVTELHRWGALNVSGRLQIMHLPDHYDFQDLRLTPFQIRAKLSGIARRNVIALQPQNALPTLDEGFFEKAIEEYDGALLIVLASGLAKLGDVDHYARVRIWKALADGFSKREQVFLSLVPLANRMAGSREIIWQALICRNYGANHMIVPSTSVENRAGNPSLDVQELVKKYCQELGVNIILGQEPVKEPGPQSEISEILAETCPPRHQQGVCIWFTGLSGAGKSTTAEILTWLLMEHGRRVTVLDGDVVRTHLSKGLGFSKEDRDINVRRIGFVASELVRIGGAVICSVVSPYRLARNDVRNMVGLDHFVEVFVDTPLEVCEARDVKGMYAKARRGGLNGFTGIDDPYEPPDHPEITLDTVNHTPQENARFILKYLTEQGFIRPKNLNPYSE